MFRPNPLLEGLGLIAFVAASVWTLIAYFRAELRKIEDDDDDEGPHATK